jgi:hypothetical protein
VDRNGFGSAPLGARLGYLHIGFSLVRLEARTDILANVDIGNIDRHDLEGRL